MSTTVDPETEGRLSERLKRLAGYAEVNLSRPAPQMAVDPPRLRRRKVLVIAAAAATLLSALAVATYVGGQPSTTQAGSIGGPAVEKIARSPLQARNGHTMVWTGQLLVIWGGSTAGDKPLADGATYDPVTRRWQMLPPSGLAPRSYSAAVWTGEEFIVSEGAVRGVTDATGAAFNPATNTWRQIAPDPTPTSAPAVVWTGTEMLVIGGFSGSSSVTSARVFNPAMDQWRTIATPPGVPLAPRPQASWSVEQRAAYMLVGDNGVIGLKRLVQYRPRVDQWDVLTTVPAPINSSPDAHVTGQWVYVVRSSDDPLMRFDLQTKQWTEVPVPASQRVYPGTFADDGRAIVYWNGGPKGVLRSLDPTFTNSFDGGGVGFREDHRLIAAGELVMSWGGFENGKVRADGVVIHLRRLGPGLDVPLKDAACAVVMKPSAEPSQVDNVGGLLRGRSEIVGLHFVSQHDAYIEFLELYKNEPELVETVSEQALPTSWRFDLRPDTPSNRQAISDLALAQPAVATTNCRS